VPVMQNFAADIAGWPIFGQPLWRLAELPPNAAIGWMEAIFLELGLLVSLVLIRHVATDEQRDHPGLAWRSALPWWLLAVALFAAGGWILGQPMQMRGTFSVGG
jgi:hypothetical protein